MAVEAPLLVRQRVLAVKLETTTGTAIALTASDAVLNVFDHQIKPDIPPNEREGQSALSPLQPVPGARMGEMSFKTELVGNGASGQAAWTLLLLASGFSVSGGVYSPASGSASYASVTIGFYQDGRFKQLAGCTGNAKLMLEAGKQGMWEWTFKGVWQAPTSVALITPTYPTTLPPRFAGATHTIGGSSYKIAKLEIDFGNEVTMRQDSNHISGYHSSVVAARKITVKVDPEAVAFGTHDFYADHLAGTTAAMACTIGSAANNTWAIAAPKLALLNPPEDGDRDGVLVDELEYLACRSAAAGDDEMTFTAT